MGKLNLVLLGILIACALGTVTSQHKARRLFFDLQKEQDLAKRLDVEYSQLELEASTWAMHSRIEKIATGQLGMRVPDRSRVVVLRPPAAERVR